MRFKRELYSKVALLKAAYNFSDRAYIHLDADDEYFYVEIEDKKETDSITELEFENEMLAQSVRHEIYLQTRNIRELILARSMATSVVLEDAGQTDCEESGFSENEILKDWFETNDNTGIE